MERTKDSHAVVVTSLGQRGFLKTLGVVASAPGDRRSH
jgi:hypothetical protein